MNWYKLAQLDTGLSSNQIFEQYDSLSKEYGNLYWQENQGKATEEDIQKRKEMGERIDHLRNMYEIQKQKEEEEVAEKIKNKRYKDLTPSEFVDYHRTGDIDPEAYNDRTIDDISWLGPKNKYPILVKTGRYGNEIIEFRKENRKLRYVKKEPDGFNHMRDKDGELIYMTDEEILSKGAKLYDTTIVAFNEKDQPVGFASDEWGADGVWVVQKYQKKGIGTDLLYEFRKQFSPERRMGQMTPAGIDLVKSYHRKLNELV